MVPLNLQPILCRTCSPCPGFYLMKSAPKGPSLQYRQLSNEPIETYVFDYGTISEPLAHMESCDLRLPDSLARAVKKRRDDFIFGRHCARMAISRLQDDPFQEFIAIAPHRGPLWPDEIVGSITHTQGLAAAAVAFSHQYLSIGIDAELIISNVSKGLKRHICRPLEIESLNQTTRFSELEVLTLIFSAKECLFKMLHPLIKVFFGFQAAQVVGIDEIEKKIQIKLIKNLGTFPQDRVFTLHFEMHASLVITQGALARPTAP